MNPLCIYHGNCADGFGAAWVVRRAFDDAGFNIEFHAGRYQDPPPDVTDREVLIVDFSYKRPVLLEMAEKAESITIIDHHKTAEEDLVDLPDNVQTTFDMDHSGAMLAWMHFFPDERAPELLRHIEDRDLWRFWLEGTREIQAAVFSYPYDFDVWDKLMDTPPEQLVEEGAAIQRKHIKDIREFIEAAGMRHTFRGYADIPVLNAPYFWSSDAGHIMAEGEPFAVCYWDTPEGRVFSLRSTDEGVDVSEIAKEMGGGGHRNAAGFRVGWEDMKKVADNPEDPRRLVKRGA